MKKVIKEENNPTETLIGIKKQAKAKEQAKPKEEKNGIPTGYKLVRSEIKNKRVNLVLTQTNFDKLHRFIEKQKAENPKASINEYFNKHIESLEE